MDDGQQTGWAPWQAGDVARLLPIIAAGVLAWAVAWIAASGERRFSDQIAWVSVGVVGLGLTFAAEAAWLLRAHRAIATHRRAILEGISGASPAMTHPASADAGRAPEPLVAGDGLTRFHRKDCPLAAGRNWTPASREAHRQAGRTACGVCRP